MKHSIAGQAKAAGQPPTVHAGHRSRAAHQHGARLSDDGRLRRRQREYAAPRRVLRPLRLRQERGRGLHRRALRCRLVEAESIWTQRSLLTALAEAVGIVRVEKTGPRILEQLIEHLNAHPRPVIIDEMDYLVKKQMVDIIRDIHNATSVAILMIGEEALPSKLKEWERFDNRILAHTPAQPASDADALKLRDHYCRRVQVADDLVLEIARTCGGVTRRIVTNLERARTLRWMTARSPSTSLGGANAGSKRRAAHSPVGLAQAEGALMASAPLQLLAFDLSPSPARRLWTILRHSKGAVALGELFAVTEIEPQLFFSLIDNWSRRGLLLTQVNPLRFAITEAARENPLPRPLPVNQGAACPNSPAGSACGPRCACFGSSISRRSALPQRRARKAQASSWPR